MAAQEQCPAPHEESHVTPGGADVSLRTASLVAGSGLAALSALSVFRIFVAMGRPGTPGVGVHLLMIGYLSYRSAFVPMIIGILLAVAGLRHLSDSFSVVPVPNYPASISQFTFIGEAVLIIWLLIKGRRIGARRTAG